MESLNYRGQEIVPWSITGEVLSSKKYSETHVTSSGGGGTVSQGEGHISPARIQSSSTTKHEIWIKTDDGREEDIKIVGADIPLREGQMITAIGLINRNSARSQWASLVNHTVGKSWYLASAARLNEALRLEYSTGISLLLAALALIGTIYYTAPVRGTGHDWLEASWGAAFWTASAIALLGFFVKRFRIAQAEKELEGFQASLTRRVFYNR